MRRLAVFLAAALVAAAGVTSAAAAPSVAYGIQDDAWLAYGPGTVQGRIATLKHLGLHVVRVTVRWDQVEESQGTYDWDRTDTVLEPLEAAGIEAIVTLYGTPSWANGGKAPNVAPIRGADFASFAAAAAERYPAIKRWTVWNEPNQRRWLSTVSPAQYVTKLLNPTFAAIHEAAPGDRVAGGVTAPRGGSGGMSPVAFIRGMGRARAHLDAYAHHPYALAPGETPWGGGCTHCDTITMATIGRLVTETSKAFGPVKLWLTELGYQSNPPDHILGVPPAMQAEYVAAAAYKAWATPRVELLIQYLYRDEPGTDRWQSGLQTTTGRTKPAMGAVAAPLAEIRRSARTTSVWGAIRNGTGRRPYRLQMWSAGRWATIGGVRRTAPGGVVLRRVTAARGAKLRLLAGVTAGNTLVVR
jgi:hypothetical protein